jgi:hypothetical protein
MATYDSTNLDTLLGDLNGLTAAQKMNIANLIFTQTFAIPNIKDTHPTLSEVRSGSKIPILEATDDYDGFPFFEGNCTLPACSINDNWSAYTWTLGEIGCEVTICMRTFSNDFKVFFDTWAKNNEGDIESALVQFIIERFQSRHLKAEVRVAYFGDSASEDTLINGFDGFFVQMEAQATEGENLVVITQNAGATAAEQTITSGEAIYDYLQSMYTLAAAKPWFEPTNMVWRLDRSLVQTLVGWLNTQADLKGISCDCIDPASVVNARVYTADNLTVFGIPVEPMPFLTAMRAIAEIYDETDGTYVNRNRIVLSRRENMILGYEIEDTVQSFKVGWDDRKNEIYIQGSSLFGAGVPQNHFVLGYGAVGS